MGGGVIIIGIGTTKAMIAIMEVPGVVKGIVIIVESDESNCGSKYFW